MNRILVAAAAAAALTSTLAACSSSSSAGSGAASSATASSATASSGTASSAASSPAAAAFPLTVTASNGKVTIKAKPTRIVSLSPTATEDLYAVGAGSQVVAVDDESDYPSNAPVTKLSGLTPNVEAIAKYDPSLVVASQDSNGLVAGLGKLGIPVLIEPAAATLDNAYDQIDQIGQAAGHAAAAQQVTSTMQTEIAADVKQAGTSHKNLTYY